MDTQLVPAYDRTPQLGVLFKEYTDMLVENDPTFREYLNLQNYDEELHHLQEKYGPPGGRLYMLLVDGQPAGCIALRRIDTDRGELKRLYIRPAYRGHRFGKQLTQQIIADARAIGYRCLLLDTLPFLRTAIQMYKALGFYEIESYNNSPMDTSIFLQLDL